MSYSVMRRHDNENKLLSFSAGRIPTDTKQEVKIYPLPHIYVAKGHCTGLDAVLQAIQVYQAIPAAQHKSGKM